CAFRSELEPGTRCTTALAWTLLWLRIVIASAGDAAFRRHPVFHLVPHDAHLRRPRARLRPPTSPRIQSYRAVQARRPLPSGGTSRGVFGLSRPYAGRTRPVRPKPRAVLFPRRCARRTSLPAE